MNKPEQLTIFDVPSIKTDYISVFHDESGIDAAHDRYQLHGALFIPLEKINETFNSLKTHRNGYQGRVHFVSLRDNSRNPKGNIASNWLNLFVKELSVYCSYKCLIIDKGSKAFDIKRFTEPYHLYNYTALNAIYSGLAWSYKNYDKIILSIFSEETSRTINDNFVTYLPRELINKSKIKEHFPIITIPGMKVKTVNGDPGKVEKELETQCEMIQLTDILTSAISEAVYARAEQKVKIDLATMVANWIEDTRLPPWIQSKQLHRRFSISCFPNINGKFYNVSFQVTSKNQMKFNL